MLDWFRSGREAWGAGGGSHVDDEEAVLDDGKSNLGVEVESELERRKAEL